MKPSYLLLSVLLLAAGLSDSFAVPDTGTSTFPYEAISKRNVFDLKPPSPEQPADTKPPEPPANFQLLGVQDTLGVKKAIFSVQERPTPGHPPKPGQKAGPETLVIKEGDTQGPIKVIHIADIKTGEMTIENSGTRMDISFKTHGAKLPAPAGPAVAGTPPHLAGRPTPLPTVRPSVMRRPAPSTVRRFTPSSRQANRSSVPDVSRPIRQSSSRLGVAMSGGAPSQAQNQNPQSQSQSQPLSREAQAIMIEINRQRTREAVSKGLLPPLPPTAITPPQDSPSGQAPVPNSNQ